MKEVYLTSQNIAAKSREFVDSIAPERQSQFEYIPRKSALLVLDMQRYFLDENSHAFIPSATAIILGLIKLIAEYRLTDQPVVFTRHINDDTNAGALARWWCELITIENPLSEIDDRFDVSGSEIIRKAQYDAFHNTGLEDLLHEKGVSQTVVCGVMTHLCCETTARSAFTRGFEVFFPVDGTATYNEQFHRATLLNLSHGFAELVLVEQLLCALRAGHEE